MKNRDSFLLSIPSKSPST
uniref:Uncharacterized protein n=1 Tax=Rhizophora mucronata TaxID=61149 RepID=A0A2P2PJ35_RHIMU